MHLFPTGLIAVLNRSVKRAVTCVNKVEFYLILRLSTLLRSWWQLIENKGMVGINPEVPILM